MKNRNIDVLEHIQKYCIRINKSISRFGDNEPTFLVDLDFQNSVCMSLFQIGELSNLLTSDFKEEFCNDINWKAMRSFRNIVAHEYGKIDFSEVWSILKNDIPELEKFCNNRLSQSNLLNQNALEPEYDDEDLKL